MHLRNEETIDPFWGRNSGKLPGKLYNSISTRVQGMSQVQKGVIFVASVVAIALVAAVSTTGGEDSSPPKEIKNVVLDSCEKLYDYPDFINRVGPQEWSFFR